jgi:hypothetical protein
MHWVEMPPNKQPLWNHPPHTFHSKRQKNNHWGSKATVWTWQNTQLLLHTVAHSSLDHIN